MRLVTVRGRLASRRVKLWHIVARHVRLPEQRTAGGQQYSRMSIRFYQITVVCFWLATMSWLLVSKLMPALHRGDPPNHHAATAAQLLDNMPVIWDMRWNFHSVGWAANHVAETPNGELELLSRLQFTDWPKTDVAASAWLLEQLADWGRRSEDFNLELANRSLLDSDYSLKELSSSIFLGKRTASGMDPWMQIAGKVEGDELQLSFQLGNRLLGKRAVPLRSHSLISSEISPHGYMPRLRIRQRWSTYQISPFRPPTSPQGTIVATVERYDPMIWNNQLVETLLVVYRRDEGSGSRSADEYLGRLWVRPDNGMVLKQEIVLLGSRFTLLRRVDDQAQSLALELQKNWDAVARSQSLEIEEGDLGREPPP